MNNNENQTNKTYSMTESEKKAMNVWVTLRMLKQEQKRKLMNQRREDELEYDE